MHLLIRPNEDVAVGRERAVLALGDRAYECHVDVTMRFVPSPKMLFRGVLAGGEHAQALFASAFGDDEATLRVSGADEPAQANVHHFSVGATSTFEVSLLKGPVYSGAKSACDVAAFHVINFPDFMSQEEGRAFRNSVTLKDATHEIRIMPVDAADEVFRELDSQGGYGNTHIGKVTRIDAAPMPFEEVSNTLLCLQYFLAFCRGAWAGVILTGGMTVDGKLVWRDLSNRLIEPWENPVSWADRHNFQVLPSAYAGFAVRWADAYWRGVLQRAIYWYLRSNRSASGVDGNIVLTQAALEYLAWAHLVESGQRMSERGFEKLPAADRLRLMLSSHGIPLPIPATLGELLEVGQGSGWDGPRAFTEVRNELVHAGRERGPFKRQRPPYFQAWTLGQWYLELAILALLDFKGQYRERVRVRGWVGEVHDVPWVHASA